MLRSFVGLAAAAAVVASGAAVVTLGAGALPPFLFSALVLAGVVWERARYKRIVLAAPDGRFRRTAERFRDPATGEPVTVYADPATGERAYVRE